MSNIIRRYKGKDNCTEMEIRAFVGGQEYGKAISIELFNGNHIELSEKQVIDLILILLKRIGLKHPFCATDTSKFELENRVVMPDGTIIVIEDEDE